MSQSLSQIWKKRDQVQMTNIDHLQAGESLLYQTGRLYIYNAIPKYDGEGDIQKLLDFADKVEGYINVVEMSSTLQVTIIITKLTGTASLLWHNHKKNYDVSSPL